MRELKFKETGLDKYTMSADNNELVKIKPFTTWIELSEIYKLVGAQNNAFMRHYAKVVEFAKVCTNIDFDGIEDTEIYDICSELKLTDEFSVLIEEYNELDRMIKSDESTYNLIKEITDSLLPQLNTAMEKIR